MLQLSRIGLTTLTFAVLCLGHAAVTRADTIAFTGTLQNFNNPVGHVFTGRPYQWYGHIERDDQHRS